MLEQSPDQRAVQHFAARQLRWWKIAAVALLTLAMVMVVGLSVYRVLAPPTTGTVIEMTYGDFLTDVNANDIASVTVYDDGNITGQFNRLFTYQQQDGLTVTAMTFHTYQRLTITGSLYLDFTLGQHGVKVYQRHSSATDPWRTLALTVTPFVTWLGVVMALAIVALTAWVLARRQGATTRRQ